VTFLRLGGLASREHVERQGLVQTPQFTDDIDRHFGIWNDVFTDSVDIHARIRNRNQYGPVVFVLEARMLATLPAAIDVLITEPSDKMGQRQEHGSRYFTTAADFQRPRQRNIRSDDHLPHWGRTTPLRHASGTDHSRRPSCSSAGRCRRFAVTQRALQEARPLGEWRHQFRNGRALLTASAVRLTRAMRTGSGNSSPWHRGAKAMFLKTPKDSTDPALRSLLQKA